MTPQIWLMIAGFMIGIATQLIVAAYIYGKLSGSVAEHGRRHDSHDTRFKELGEEQGRQWESMGRHGEKISAVEARVQSMESNWNSRGDRHLS